MLYMRIKVVTWITFFIAVSIISFSLYILYSDNSQENEGILGIGIGLLIGYIGIIKNKPDIYEIESQDIDNIIDLNGTKVIISKFNEITDTIEKIFPIQKANNSEPIVIENKNSLPSSLQIAGTLGTGIVTGTGTTNGTKQLIPKVMPSQKKYSEPLMNILRKNPSADEGINGQRRLVNLFEKFEPAEPKTISRTELNFPKRKNEEIALPIVLPQPTATTQTPTTTMTTQTIQTPSTTSTSTTQTTQTTATTQTTQTPSTTTTQTTSTTQTPTTTSTTQAPSTLTTQTT